MKGRLLSVLFAACLSGCVSFNETEFPQVDIRSLPEGRNPRVQLLGLDAVITTYTPVYGYATVMGGGSYYGYGPYRHRYYGPYMTTVATETFIPQSTATSVFKDRAVEILEKSGCILQTTDPQYRIEVTFGGPYVSDSDSVKIFCWNLFTLLTADYGTQTWTAKLKIHEVKTGKLLFSSDYSQKYEVNVWGPVPLFSPGASSKTKYSVMQSWCLTALTDRTLADAINFLRSSAQ